MKKVFAVASIALTCALIVVPANSAMSEEKRGQSKEEVLKQLQGTWLCVAEERDGKAFSKSEVKLRNRRWSIVDGKLTTTEVSKGILETGEARIDIKPGLPFGEFNYYGKIVRIGIYQLDGDTFRLCWGNPNHDTERPSKFETTLGSHRQFFVFKRDAE